MANLSSSNSDDSVVFSDIINETVQLEEIVLLQGTHQHFDLNEPISNVNQIASSEFSHYPLGFHQSIIRNEVEGRIFVKEEKQMSREEIESNQTSDHKSPNLYLNFPPPLVVDGISIRPQPSCERSCKSSNKGLYDRIKIEADRPSLVVMGCYYCLLYVMVSEIDPVCPRCKSATSLGEVLHGSCRKK